MTQLLFQTDSYIKEFNAVVVEVNQAENAIVLDRTAFYPGGGGQPNDVGMIFVTDDYLPITKVKSQAGLVWHWINGALPVVGSKVEGHLNWDHRYQLMRTHTSLHVLCGVVWRDYGAHHPVGSLQLAVGSLQSAVASLQSPVGSPHLTTSKLQTVD